MNQLITKTTLAQAHKGDRDCIELALSNILEKIGGSSLLIEDELSFLKGFIDNSLLGKKRRGRTTVNIDTKLAIFFEMSNEMKNGASKTKAAELAVEKIKNRANIVRDPRCYLNTFNELEKLGWKHDSR